MGLLTLIPYHTETLDLPLSKEEAEQLLEISSDPENENAQLVTSKSQDGRWLLVRRPGMLNNLLLILGRVRLEVSDTGDCRAEVSIGLQPLVSLLVLFVFSAVTSSLALLDLEPLVFLFPLVALTVMLTLTACGKSLTALRARLFRRLFVGKPRRFPNRLRFSRLDSTKNSQLSPAADFRHGLLSVVLEDRFLRKAVRNMLTFDP